MACFQIAADKRQLNESYGTAITTFGPRATACFPCSTHQPAAIKSESSQVAHQDEYLLLHLIYMTSHRGRFRSWHMALARWTPPAAKETPALPGGSR